MFSSTAFAEWTYLGTDFGGNDFLIDYDRIKKNNGFEYYWTLTNFLEPDNTGNLSAQMYSKGDCKLLKVQTLSYVFYKQEMGKGDGETISPTKIEWVYPVPNSPSESFLNEVCKQ